MNQKIEWYREVLEIEPNSKIFFPLSRMLAKDGRPDEAIAVLRQGVGRHPDHVEARLFLVELLYSGGRAVELQQEIDVLSVLFKNYPGFWRAWGEKLFDEQSSRDAGLAAIFFAAFLQNTPVSWAGVIAHGLKGLVSGENIVRPSATVKETHPLSPQPASPAEAPVADVLLENFVSAPVAPILAVKESIPAEEPQYIDDGDVAEDEDEEPITLRTRSMAEILAEQGDIPGALDIYSELLATTSSEAERTELSMRMDVLSGKTVPVTQASEQQAEAETKKDWLAALAQRLEARSLQ